MVVVFEVLVIDVLNDAEIIVVGVIVIVLKCVLPVPYSVDAPSSDVTVDWLVDVLAGKIFGVLSSIGVDVLADATLNMFAVLAIPFEFVIPDPLEEEEFRC